MPSGIMRRQQRLVVARAMLEIMRQLSMNYLGAERFGGRADEAVLLLAIFVGQAEGRPMGASKLAEFAGLARPTVVRKLRELEADGSVMRDADGCYIIPVSKLNSPAVMNAVDKSIKTIVKSADQLSKLDTQGIAPMNGRFIDRAKLKPTE